MVNGLACESLQTMPRRQAEEASPPIQAPPAGAGASGQWGTFRPLAASHSVCPVFGCSRAGISASHLTESTFMSSMSSSQGPNRLGPCSACRM